MEVKFIQSADHRVMMKLPPHISVNYLLKILTNKFFAVALSSHTDVGQIWQNFRIDNAVITIHQNMMECLTFVIADENGEGLLRKIGEVLETARVRPRHII